MAEKVNKTLANKWANDPPQFERITNQQLVCRDCGNRFEDDEIFGNTTRCGVFPHKPNPVILGAKTCPAYVKETL